RRRAAGATLVEQHDAVLRRIVEAPHLRAAAAAGAAVQQHHRLAAGVAALLEVQAMAVGHLQEAGVEGFDLGIEAAHAASMPQPAPGPAILELASRELVGAARFELATPTTPLWCATRLRYAPTGGLLPRSVARGE